MALQTPDVFCDQIGTVAEVRDIKHAYRARIQAQKEVEL
jgi:ATP:corrinoid adenosyltransferase